MGRIHLFMPRRQIPKGSQSDLSGKPALEVIYSKKNTQHLVIYLIKVLCSGQNLSWTFNIATLRRFFRSAYALTASWRKLRELKKNNSYLFCESSKSLFTVVFPVLYITKTFICLSILALIKQLFLSSCKKKSTGKFITITDKRYRTTAEILSTKPYLTSSYSIQVTFSSDKRWHDSLPATYLESI